MAQLKDERTRSEQYGRFTREVSGVVMKIVEDVVKKTMEAAQAKGYISEKYLPLYSVPGEHKGMKTNNNISNNDIVEVAVKAAIPAALTALGVGLGGTPVVTVLLAGGGGVISTQIGKGAKSQIDHLAEFDPESVQAEVTWDRDVLDQAWQTAQREIDALKESVGAYEKKCSDVIDVSLDRGFGEWVQQFLLYCNSQPDDPQLRLLRNVLISRLACMRISVYDQVELNIEGKPDVPYQDYLIDKRKGTEYTQVAIPAVYSDKAILARGEIR